MPDRPEQEAEARLGGEYVKWATSTGAMLTRHRFDGTISYVSGASRTIVGWDPEELVGKKLRDYLHAEDARVIVKELGKSPPENQTATVTCRLLRKDGTYGWVEATGGVTVGEDGASPEIITIFHDVSGRGNIDNQVRRAQEVLRSIFERIPMVIAILDREGTLQYINRYCEALFGWSLKELQAPGAWERMYKDPEPREQAQQWAKEPAPGVVELRTRTKSGGSVAMRWIGTKLGDGGSVGIGIDISGRLAAEEALRESEAHARALNDQLLEADRRKNEFLAILAHELRNPLAPIMNNIDALLRRQNGDAETTRLHELIREKAKHLIRLIDDLLDVSRITNGVIHLEHTICDIGEVLRQAVTTSQPLFERGRQRLVMDNGPHPVRVRGDSVRLVQVFSNLLGNAAKFTPAGGDIAVSVTASGDFIDVRIRDAGKGIAPEALPHVFDLFFQTPHPHGAMGIGLFLARTIVELHGGTIEAQSEGEGSGAEFIVRLPRLAAEDAGAEASECLAPPKETAGNGRCRRVLVVDDDPAVADGFALLLESMGQEVQVVHDGLAAVDATTRFDPEIVFIDLSMPGLDGYETARRIRSLPASETRRLVALTGFGRANVELQLREAGFDQYLAKPAQPEDLERLLA